MVYGLFFAYLVGCYSGICKDTIVLFSIMAILLHFPGLVRLSNMNVIYDDKKFCQENGESLFFMKPSIVQRELDEVLETSATVENCNTQVRQPSYHPTSWPKVNSILDVVDDLTHGRAGLAQRFFSFALVGGFAACVNLLGDYIIVNKMHFSNNTFVQNTVAYLIAMEISLFANFIPNDYFTFRDMKNGRPWIVRCLRFHVTASSGVLLNFLIYTCLSSFFNVPSIVALAIAILIVLFYNFAFHHLFTYRHKHTPAIENVSASLTMEQEAELMIEQMEDTLKHVVVKTPATK